MFGISPECTQFLPNNMQAQIKHYLLKHHLTVIINVALGETIINISAEVLTNASNFKILGKGKLAVVVSQTK